jgi:hypothetical protein
MGTEASAPPQAAIRQDQQRRGAFGLRIGQSGVRRGSGIRHDGAVLRGFSREAAGHVAERQSGGGDDRAPMLGWNDARLPPLAEGLGADMGQACCCFGTAKAVYDIIDCEGHGIHIREVISQFNAEAKNGKKLPVAIGHE